MESFNEVVTDDMAMVAYLKMKGHAPETISWNPEASLCRWQFNANAVPDATDFMEDRALVNPRHFTRAFASAKREMHRAQDTATTH